MTPSPLYLVQGVRLDATLLSLALVGHVSSLVELDGRMWSARCQEEDAGVRVGGPSGVDHCAVKLLLPFAGCLAYV